MSTNFFYTYDRCDCCGRGEKIHMCKSLLTWRAYIGESEEVVQFGHEIRNWQQWKEALRKPGISVTDEYGDDYEVEEFIKKAEEVSPSVRNVSYLRQLEATSIVWDRPETFWQDIDGFMMQTGDFR